MKRLLLVAAAVLFVASSVCFAQGKDSLESITLPAGGIPQITQVVGTTEVELGPTRFPIFRDAKGTEGSDSEAACAAALMKLNPDDTNDGFSLAPLPPNLNSTTDKKYVVIPDLVVNNFEIGGAFKKTTKLLITWTVRVEGEQPKAKDPKCMPCNTDDDKNGPNCTNNTHNIGYRIFPCLRDSWWKPTTPCPCPSWHGTAVQVFKGGIVSSQLYVNDKPVGNLASMTMPDAGEEKVIQINDPTITGSCLLSKDDFGGELPSVIKKIEVRWYNDTTLKISSPKNTHNLIIKMMPVTSSN